MEDPLSEGILAQKFKAGDTVYAYADGDEIKFDTVKHDDVAAEQPEAAADAAEAASEAEKTAEQQADQNITDTDNHEENEENTQDENQQD